MFEQSQIQEFKEAFGMIDANQDGFIDKGRIYLDLSECPRYFFRLLPRLTVYFENSIKGWSEINLCIIGNNVRGQREINNDDVRSKRSDKLYSFSWNACK